MPEPEPYAANYCDMAENPAPGLGGGTCCEIDLLEANNAMQSAIHETGGAFGSGNCDRNGRFARTGGPEAPGNRRGTGCPAIDTAKPFDVEAAVDADGRQVNTAQEGRTDALRSAHLATRRARVLAVRCAT